MDDHDPQLWGVVWGHWGEGLTLTNHIFGPPKQREIILTKCCYMQFKSGICFFLFGGFGEDIMTPRLKRLFGRRNSCWPSDLGWSWLSPGKRLVHILLEQAWQTFKLQQSLFHLFFEVRTKYLFVFIYIICAYIFLYLNYWKCFLLSKQVDVTWYASNDWSSCKVYGVSVWLGLLHGSSDVLAVPRWGYHVVKCWKVRGLLHFCLGFDDFYFPLESLLIPCDFCWRQVPRTAKYEEIVVPSVDSVWMPTKKDLGHQDD